MRWTITLLLTLVVASVHAHFQLQFPPPRGAFDEDKEPTFCDGYSEPASNRTQFPMIGGYYTMKVEHSKWIAGVLVTTASNATSFANFFQVDSFGQGQGEGSFCVPLDFSKSNVTGLQAGQNVTIQIVLNGGDGALYQCADLTLANDLNLSGTVSCSNSTQKSSALTSLSAGSVHMMSGLTALISLLGLLFL